MAPLDPDSSSPTIENKLDASQSPYTMDALPTTAAPLPLQERSQSLSAKRPRNADDRLLIPPCTIPSDLAPVATFVDKAIGAPALTPYRSIVDCVKRRNDANLLHRLLIVFRVNGSTLHQLMTFPKQHAQLLHSIFRLDPFFVPSKMVDDEDFNKLVKSFELAYAHLHLCVAMVSANSTFLQPALNCLWKLLTTTKNANEDLTEGRVKCVHAALSTILRLVPKGATDLFPIMSSGFPFRIRPHLKEYSEHCLSVLEYAPTLEAQVLELLIDKALEMDVEIKIKSSGDVEIDDEKFVKPSDDDDAIFDLEMDDTALHQEMQSKKEESKSLAERRIDEMADKLDSIMLLLFQHVEQRVQKDPACAPLLFQMIIPVFESTVLTTHRSKYVQFIVFYLCGCNTTTAGDLYRDFAGHLVEAVLDHYRATVTRQSAACYLASFVSRGKYACPETACEAVAALLRWAEAYLSVVVSNNKNGNDVRSMCESHSLFYTVCQAAYYIMCFRGAEAVQFYREAVDYHARNPKKTEDSPYPDLDHIDMAPERWEKICGHRLQPLRFCLESVREEFILVAQVFNLLPPALSKNLDIEAQQQSSRPRRKGKSINTPATTMAGRRRKGGVGGLGRGSNPLDSFFPFDPYLLQRSSDYVDPLYRNWEKSIEEETDILEDQLEEDDDEELEDAIHIDSDDSADDDSDDDDDSSGEEQTHMTASVESTNFLQTMSYNSAASISSSVPKNSPSTSDYRQAQQEAWSTALKRPRAPSIAENGSW